MPSNITFSFDYDPSDFLKLFNDSEKSVLTDSITQANLGENVTESPLLESFFYRFPFISKNNSSAELIQFVGSTRPHINPGNNGLLVFPIRGSLTLNTFSYVPPTKDENGRPTMDPKSLTEGEIAAIEATKVDSVTVSTPMAVDGLTTHSFSPAEVDPIFLILKIDKTISWSHVEKFFNAV
jgi:hypothetical protein